MLNMHDSEGGVSTPAATMTARPLHESPIKAVGVPLQHKVVTFSLQQTTHKGHLQLPYAVAINGQVPAEFKDQLKVILLPNQTPRGIRVPCHAGDKVALYLGSDASPQWRTSPVFEVPVKDNDVIVHITEQPGLNQRRGLSAQPATSPMDEYQAAWTGDIWMRCSHRYTPDEVASRMPEGTSPQVQAVIERIYQGLSQPQLEIAAPITTATGETQARRLKIHFEDSDNPKKNVTGYSLLRDGLTRVHPAGYAALFNAALENDVQSMTVTSCWRPMLGSIVHRVGMGLDVNYLGPVRLNRQELTLGKAPSKDADENVSEDEKAYYKAYLQAMREVKRAEKELDRLSAPPKNSSIEKEKAEEELRQANERLKGADDAWNSERNRHEPLKVKAFRKSIYQCNCVRQLFDPWYMAAKTEDHGLSAVPNTQIDSNEKLHAHHLHITVKDKKVLPS